MNIIQIVIGIPGRGDVRAALPDEVDGQVDKECGPYIKNNRPEIPRLFPVTYPNS